MFFVGDCVWDTSFHDHGIVMEVGVSTYLLRYTRPHFGTCESRQYGTHLVHERDPDVCHRLRLLGSGNAMEDPMTSPTTCYDVYLY